MRCRPPAFTLHLLLLIPSGMHAAQQEELPLPLTTGAAIVQTLTFDGGDRESVHLVRQGDAEGLRYSWSFLEVHASGDTIRGEYRYLEAAADLASARRIKEFHDTREQEAHPGYTMHAISRAVYRTLRRGVADSFQVMSLAQPPGAGGPAALGFGSGRRVPVRWRGTLTPAGTEPVPFPLLVNGRRVQVPAIRVRGSFAARQRQWETELLVLADSTYPLLLRWTGAFQKPENVLQTTQVNVLSRDSAAGTGVLDPMLEETLRSTCRADMPGVYFEFNSAALNPASDRALGSIAALLARHPEWSVTIEGHTDSIGSAVANQKLSERRVQSVRARLVERHKVDPARLRTRGHGAARPKESNATVEGRARNRRVELVRDC